MQKISRTDPRNLLMVGIAGGSASGKTTLAREILSLAADNVALIELDRFYHPLLPDEDAESKNYDHPSALDFELLRQSCCQLQAEGHATIPIYDFSQHDRVGYEEILAKPIVIVEGILAFWNSAIRDLLKQRLFVETPTEIRFERRRERDRRERGRDDQSIKFQWLETVEPMYHRYVKTTQTYADRTIDGTLDLRNIAKELLRDWQS